LFAVSLTFCTAGNVVGVGFGAKTGAGFAAGFVPGVCCAGGFGTAVLEEAFGLWISWSTTFCANELADVAKTNIDKITVTFFMILFFLFLF